MIGLLGFELRLLVRRGWLAPALVAYAVAAAGVTALGLSTFRVLGLGASSPAALALLDLGLLVPSAFALVVGATSLGADREGGLLPMLAAAGYRVREIVVAHVAAAAASAWLMLLAGYGASALVLAGNVAAGDLGAFATMAAASLLTTLATAAIGVIVGAALRERHEAIAASLAIWFALAIGLEVAVLALAPLVRGGSIAVILLLALDPLEAGRALGLIALGLEGDLLGALGLVLERAEGRTGAALVLVASLSLWTAAATAGATWLLDERSS